MHLAYFADHPLIWHVNPEKASILLDTLAFFLVTPEFVGPARLERLQEAMAAGGDAALAVAERIQAVIRSILPFNPTALARLLAAMILIAAVVAEAERLRPSPIWVGILASIFGLTMLALVPWWFYVLSLLETKIFSALVRVLARQDALRFAVFTLGTASLLMARLIAWFHVSS